MVENTGSIEALLQEDRTFPPPLTSRRGGTGLEPVTSAMSTQCSNQLS